MDDLKIQSTNLIDKMHEIGSESIGNAGVSHVGSPSTSFKDCLENAVNSVNDVQNKSEVMKAKYVAEDPSVSLSSVMIQMQKAEVSLSALSAVKDKLVEGFKSLLSMTV